MPTRRLLLLFTLLIVLATAGPAAAAQRIVRFDPQQTSATQLRAQLTTLGLGSTALSELPFALAVGDSAALARVDALPGVVSTHANERLAFHLHESAPLLFGGEQRRAAAYAAGYDGRGQNVAVIDTGTDGLHPDLRDRVVRNVKIVGVPDEFAPGDQFHAVVECPTACTTDTTGGHGTHVSGTAVGTGAASSGYHVGIAPGAGLVGISVGDAVAMFHALSAYDYLLAHPELGVVAVNNSFGPSGGGRFDATDPMNVATRKLHAAGITVVFSAGNSGFGEEQDPEGSSDCAPQSESACKINPYGVAPWTISVANLRKDYAGSLADQPLNLTSSRGDPDPQQSVDGSMTVTYHPTISAPGTNIRAARAINGVASYTCGASAEPPSCTPAKPEHEPYYASMSGTSMAAPHVTGAIAVLQSAAVATQGRRLTPDEVKQLITSTAATTTKIDGYWDWPCGDLLPCGTDVKGTTAQPYAPWQVGAGALNLDAALAAVTAPAPTPAPTPTKKPKKPR